MQEEVTRKTIANAKQSDMNRGADTTCCVHRCIMYKSFVIKRCVAIRPSFSLSKNLCVRSLKAEIL